jgi:hypothetical protein
MATKAPARNGRHAFTWERVGDGVPVRRGRLLTPVLPSGARGVFQLGNGNILWTNSAGAHIYDVGMGSSSLVYAGGGRYLQQVSQIPEPSTIALWAAGLALVGARLRASQRRREAARG